MANAHDIGKAVGFAKLLSFAQIKKSAFEKIGAASAKVYYKTEKKRQEFLVGWMSNWSDSQPASDEEILTY